MQTKHDMDRRIDEIMSSLDGMHRAEANPFLYTRVRERLASRLTVVEKIVAFAGKPVFAFAILLIVIVTNVSVILQSRTSNETTEQSQLAIADEYRNTIAAYDYENPEP